MRLAELAETSRLVAATSSRRAKVDLLAGLLRRLRPEEVEVAVAFLSGEPRQGRVGLGPAALRDASAGPPPVEAALELLEADRAFAAIGAVSGAGAARERARLLGALLGRATLEERDLLRRLVAGELRQGALEGVMEEAVARAAGLPAAEVRRAAMRARDLRAVAAAALGEGRAGLGRFAIRLFQPVRPMLAQAAGGIEEALERLGEAALEHKLDGARVQIHKSGGEVRVYSRGLRDVTPAVPELVAAVAALGPAELILDGEVIALRPDGTPHPFATTMRRFGRRLDVERLRAELPLTPCFFDLLRLEGEDLVAAPARERFAALAAAAGAAVVPRLVTADPAAAAAFLEQALARGHEGVVAKAPDSPYEAGSRGAGWLKVKHAESLDLVVLAAEWGNGRRRGWLSNLHLGARDPAAGGFQMIGKTFKGMTDAMLEWQTRRFQEIALGTEGGVVVHLRPEVVVEVAFNDVQRSPHYPSGMALRFARVKRYRTDKTPDEADTVETVRRILARGEAGGPRGGSGTDAR